MIELESLQREEREYIQKITRESNPIVKEELINKLLTTKINIICTINETTKNEKLKLVCNNFFTKKITELEEKYNQFSRLYEYLKEEEDTENIQQILKNISTEINKYNDLKSSVPHSIDSH